MCGEEERRAAVGEITLYELPLPLPLTKAAPLREVPLDRGARVDSGADGPRWSFGQHCGGPSGLKWAGCDDTKKGEDKGL